MQPRDTQQADHQRQIEIYRAMTPAQRVAQIFELTEFARSVTRAGIAADHPGWTSEQVQRELVRRILGADHPALVSVPHP